MFLASNEMKHAKGKFILIILLVVLVSYLVYFLTSLAYGLASSYTNGIDKIGANHIILNQNANDNLMMSILDQDDFDSVNATKAKLGLSPLVVSKEENSKEMLVESYMFGIEDNSFIYPNEFSNLQDFEVIVDSEFENIGYKIGDKIYVSGRNQLFYTIKGFTSKSTYITAPIIYANMNTWHDLYFQGGTSRDVYNAIFIKGEFTLNSTNLISYTLSDFYQNLPGYQAQVLTFSIMIGFLIVIVAFVLGIFIYVLTMQKVNIFGVMKAQGISNYYIGKSVIIQTLILVIIGILIGFILTILSGILFNGKVPFAYNPLFYSVISLLFIGFSLLGASFSVGAVLKIDPLKAIG